jgi:hypothetical protein
MKIRLIVAPLILSSLALSACVPSGQKPDPRRDNGAFSDESARLCLKNLEKAKVSFASLPNTQYGGGCQAVNAVRVIDLGLPVTNLGPMTCNLTSAFESWKREVVRPAARKYLASDLARIETSGTYSCRRVGGNGNLSQHAYANAVDVTGFVTKDGRKITVLRGWNGGNGESQFLRKIHADACGRFGTVLGPKYDRQHANHFHLDVAKSRMNGNPFCR